MIGDVIGPITNGTWGVYWLAEEDNRILHVNISVAPDRHFQCVGAVQTCMTAQASTCRSEKRESPNISIMFVGKC